MSASLVGSEMCIRDRAIVVEGVAVAGWRGGGGYGNRRPRGDKRALRSACLLYTSDAADDM
eukprot:5025217-Alexandrium_andersonii.AAC.1